MTEHKYISHLLRLLWLLACVIPVYTSAQSGALQLSLLLESDQTILWTREYEVNIAEDIPATVVLGKLEGDNSVIGMIKIEGLQEQLVLHGIQNASGFNLHEWVNNNQRTGSLEVRIESDILRGYWYNRDKTIRLPVQSRSRSATQEIRQYQSGQQLFFTKAGPGIEQLLDQRTMNEKLWKKICQPGQRCYHVPVNISPQELEFCRSGKLDLYSYNRVDLARILHGLVPQIPHDETFNTQVSQWLNEWASLVFRDSLGVEERWSHNQNIWFVPDYLTDDLVSGLLCIQFSGEGLIHSQPLIYDRQKRIFYTEEDFFRSTSDWAENFQNKARNLIYDAHQTTIDVFPEILDRIKFHMTLTPNGMLISSDFTPYFGRLTVRPDKEIYQEDLQRFAPFRKLLVP